MSVNHILNTALTGLRASQAGMRTTSANISNVNTPGYAREQLSLTSRSLDGIGAGVDVLGVRRITDAFLVAASLSSSARAGGSAAVYELLDRVQSFFGDPSSGATMFSSLNEMFAGFAEVAADPSSPVRRAASISDMRSSFAEYDRVANEIQAVRGEADARISHVVDRINDLLQDVGDLNTQIARSYHVGESSGAENALSQVLDELSGLIDIRVIRQNSGALEVRTTDGVLLAGNTVATLSYSSIGIASPGDTHPAITIQSGVAPAQTFESHVRSGELRGLLDVRDRELPAIAAILGEFAGKTADALNRAHSTATAYPPVQIMTGRDTGLRGADAVGFTGSTTLTVLGADGTLAHRVDIDFDAGTIAVDGGGPAAYGATLIALEGALNAVFVGFGAGGSVNIAPGGVFEFDAGAGFGLAFVEGTPPSSRGGRGFAHFFGLNDVATSARPLFFETGFTAADGHGFAGGGAFTLRLESSSGATLREATITMTAGETFGDVLADLNDPVAGLGAFGTWSLDGDGELHFAPAAGFTGSSMKVLSDTTARGASSHTFTDLFGVGDGVRSARAFNLAVRADIDADPSRLALGKVDLAGVAIGDIVTGSGDGAGGSALRAAGSTGLAFDAAGGFPSMSSTLLDYAGRVAGEVGRRAGVAERQWNSAEALRSEAAERRASVEGVNLEEELVSLTTFQQSFNAASRLIQAAKEMSDTLMQMI
jgi:flagellar hook-associated protein 1 FlgK